MLNSTNLTVSLSTGETNSFGNVTVANESFVHQTQSTSNPITNGTGSGQATRTVDLLLNPGTGGLTLDLTATGAATGLDGKNRDFSNGGSGGCVKQMIIENLDAAATITITQPGSNGWTGLSGAATGLNYPIEPGGHVVIDSPVAGKAVSSTNKSLIFTSSAGTPSLRISMVGVAA